MPDVCVFTLDQSKELGVYVSSLFSSLLCTASNKQLETGECPTFLKMFLENRIDKQIEQARAHIIDDKENNGEEEERTTAVRTAIGMAPREKRESRCSGISQNIHTYASLS
jgi:hypothetical protein